MTEKLNRRKKITVNKIKIKSQEKVKQNLAMIG